ncbi:MAG: CBS domain-containing protein [Nocardioidaceae bacterium]|nr:CBS domain-containing protein [Nocardioidaceae bacterium]
MRARDLAEPFPTVSLDADAMAAAQTMAAARLPGLIVCGDDGRPYTVLPGSQVLNFIIPKYVQVQPGLARAFDERASDELSIKLANHTVRDMVPKPAEADELPVVDVDATAIEVAAVMARMHSPVAAVIDGNRVLGAITVSRLLTHFLPA